MDILDVDNTAVREAQIRRLEQLRANRDEDKVQSCLEAITNATESGEGNLLALALEAARARASLGEISFAVERFVAVIKQLFALFLAYTPANMKMMMSSKKFAKWQMISKNSKVVVLVS